MEATFGKDERIELRVSAEEKRIFKRAQKLSGDKTFSGFILRIVKKQAEEIVSQNDSILTTERDREIFFDAVYGNSSPNQILMEGAQKYKSQSTKK
jgi:uncharacterized protein (DUF1778 family)